MGYVIKYGTTELELLENELIPINKQVNEVGDLNVFKSDFAREFKIKRTREMDALFENAAMINSETTLPYEELTVFVYSNGVEVLPNAKLKIINTDNLYFYCSVYSGMVQVFDVLKDRKISDIDLSDLEHTWSSRLASESIVNDYDYQYLLCDFSDDGLIVGVDGTDLVFQSLALRPFVRVSRLIDEIFSDYNLESDIEANETYLKMFIPITTLKTNKSQIQSYLVQYSNIMASGTHDLNISSYYGVFDPLGLVQQNKYIAAVNGVHYFRISHPYSLFSSPGEVVAKVDGSEVSTFIGKDVILGYYLSVNLSIGDEVTFHTSGIYYFTKSYSFYCYDIDPTTIGLGSTIIPNTYLPAITHADLVKSLCKFFGLVTSYDSITNTVKLWYINNVKDNKAIAKDWSKYLSLGEFELSYQLDYAKINRLKWKPDDDVGEGNGDSFIAVSDYNLPKEKDILNMPFGFCDEVTHEGEKMCRIGWFETVSDSDEYKEKENISARIVLRESFADSSPAIGAYITEEGESNYTLTNSEAKKATVTGLDLSVSVGYNQAIVDMLDRTKLIVLPFNLPAKEINRLDHSIPIYLKQYASYFFVKSVKDWIDGYICKVELIRV